MGTLLRASAEQGQEPRKIMSSVVCAKVCDSTLYAFGASLVAARLAAAPPADAAKLVAFTAKAEEQDRALEKAEAEHEAARTAAEARAGEARAAKAPAKATLATPASAVARNDIGPAGGANPAPGPDVGSIKPRNAPSGTTVTVTARSAPAPSPVVPPRPPESSLSVPLPQSTDAERSGRAARVAARAARIAATSAGALVPGSSAGNPGLGKAYHGGPYNPSR